MKITQYAVTRRLATSAIVSALLVLGIYGLWRLPVDFLPDVTYPLTKVKIWWSGATPQEIERNLAEPIERELATADGLDYLMSSAIEGIYSLDVNFRYGIDADAAYQNVVAIMSRVSRDLPADIDPPVIWKADPSQLPIAQLTIHSDEWNLVQLRSWTERWLQDKLLTVSGVAGTEVVGGLKREIRIHLDPRATEKLGLTPAQVIKSLRQENVDQFGGRVTVGSREIIARTTGEYSSLDDIRSVMIDREGLSKVLLKDVAQVEDTHEQARVITRLDGRPCVKLSIRKQADANTVTVARGVMQRIGELEPALPAGIRIGMVENQAEYIEDAIGGVRNAAIEAAIFLVLVTYLFLGSWRKVLAMVVTLSITILVNFGLMKLAGFSLNIFSLGGLVVAIGVAFDNSTVVLENITRVKHERPQMPSGEAAVGATAEVGSAVLAATLSFLALFVSFLLTQSFTTLLFRELILVVAGIVVISLAVALSITPMLDTILTPRAKSGPRPPTRFERFFARVTDTYGGFLAFSLRHRWATLGVFALMFLGGALTLSRVGGEFLPKMDDGRVVIKVKLPTGSSVEQTDKALQRLEIVVADDPLIKSAFTLVGGKQQGPFTYEVANEGEINIQLVPRGRRELSTKQYIQRLRKKVARVPLPSGKAMVMQGKLKGTRQKGESDIEVKITGEQVGQLFALAGELRRTMENMKHFENVHVSLDMTKPEYHVKVDRVRAAELGVSVAEVASTLRTLVHGEVATQYREGEEYYDVRVMLREHDVNSRDAIENLTLSTSRGGNVRMMDVAEVAEAQGPVEIIRENQTKQVVVRGDAAGVSVREAKAEVQEALDNLDLPPGYEIAFGGQAEMMAEMLQDVLVVLALAVFFSFIVLVVQFNNLKLPALILGCVPVCLAGFPCMLFLAGLPLGATVIIGMLVVIAVTVNDGVLLMTFAHELESRENLSPHKSVLRAATIRLRPRLMTTMTTLACFAPLALNLEEGGDMLQPMAVGAIGGLLVEMPVALFLMPCVYRIFSRAHSKNGKRESSDPLPTTA